MGGSFITDRISKYFGGHIVLSRCSDNIWESCSSPTKCLNNISRADLLLADVLQMFLALVLTPNRTDVLEYALPDVWYT